MSSVSAFTPDGNTVTFTAANVAPTSVQAVSATGSATQHRIINAGTVTVFMGAGSNNVNATANAVVITTGSPTIPLLPGTDEILSFSPNQFFTGITSSGTAVVYITPGSGV